MAELRLYNTMSGEKEVFTPQHDDQVSMYVCGPTVYNYAHIGNARPVVVFDCLYRVLKARYSEVRYARNITDIDDKIIHAAQEQGVDISAVSEEFTEKYREDMAALNALAPTIEPKATEHIEEMISLTQRLVETGHAYESDGHVLFAVESMQDYGALSGRKLDDMMAGARVEVADYKRHAGDFVLWKPSTESEPGWDSPWGRGRPGWHLECSAMIRAHLGESIDIHGGGRDLIFPHHENERAQSCCAYGGDFVRHWMHNAYVDMDGEKMSKSLGNTRTVRELLGQYPGEVLRCALISAQYRSPLNFSEALLEQARSALDSWYGALRRHGSLPDVPTPGADTAVYRALMDDLNTPEAFAAMHTAAATLNKSTDAAEIDRARGELLGGGQLLGLLASDPDMWFQQGVSAEGLSAGEIEAQIAARAAAKADKDYQLADSIRAALEADGVVLEDGAAGTTWRRGS
ncbi:MAG: cysteine--tRNA ligase [Halieaceae bacterium]|nr:cysteine--tRNA ligase [Halieaceae bacterium]